MPYIPNEALTREQGEQIIDALKGKEPKEYGYPYTNEVLNKEQGDRIIKNLKNYKSTIALSDLIDDAEHRLVTDEEKETWDGYQDQIDLIVAKSDVVDVVGTYQQLMAYDTSQLLSNDVVKVLDDSTHVNARSYYRWIIGETIGEWHYIGSESISYTKTEIDSKFNNTESLVFTLEDDTTVTLNVVVKAVSGA